MSKKQIRKVDLKIMKKLDDGAKNQTPLLSAGLQIIRELMIAFKNNIIKN